MNEMTNNITKKDAIQTIATLILGASIGIFLYDITIVTPRYRFHEPNLLLTYTRIEELATIVSDEMQNSSDEKIVKLGFEIEPKERIDNKNSMNKYLDKVRRVTNFENETSNKSVQENRTN